MNWCVLFLPVAALATVGSLTSASAQNGGTIPVRGTPIFLIITNSQSFESNQAARKSAVEELRTADELEFFYVNQGTNVHRLMTMRPSYAFSCKLYDSAGRAMQKNRGADHARLDPPKLSTQNIGRYLQPINLSPAAGPRTVLFKTEEVFKIEQPGRYTLEIALWLWSSESNTLYKSEALKLPIHAKGTQ